MNIDLSNTTDEAYLVQCCKDNQPAAQKILYNRYVEDMMLLCLRYIPDQGSAREVLMDSFLSFFRKIDSFTYRGEGSLKAWLKKIVVNQCLMALRKHKTDIVFTDDISVLESEQSGDDVLAHLAVKDILRLIQQLPDGYRMVFNLFVFEGMSHKEIGDMLGITESTSKSQFHRARKMLQDKLLKKD